MTARFVRSARCYSRRRSFDKDFAEQPGDRFQATQTNRAAGRHCYKSLFLLPDRPVSRCFPVASTSSMSPTMTSGPGTRVGDCRTDCMLHGWHDHRFRFAVNKLVDLDRLHCRADGDCSTTAPASDGRPSAWANSFETTSLPFVMASDCAAAIVIVLVSMDVEKGESCIAVAHGKIGPLTRRKFFDCEPIERRA